MQGCTTLFLTNLIVKSVELIQLFPETLDIKQKGLGREWNLRLDWKRKSGTRTGYHVGDSGTFRIVAGDESAETTPDPSTTADAEKSNTLRKCSFLSVVC